jgi:hypothetical protein
MKLKQIMILVAAILLSATTAWSQDFEEDMERNPQVREKVQAARVAYITKRLNLSTRESEAFWALHNEYENERRKLKRQYKVNTQLEAMSDQEVKEMLDRRFEMQQALLDLDRDYYQRFQKVISPRKVALYHKADKEFRLELLRRVKREKENRQGPGRRFRN